MVSPEFHSSKLLVSDFDSTYAMTNEPSPAGMTVHRAYELGVETVFGYEALSRYRQEGGLRNRGAAEVISQISPGIDPSEHAQRTEELVQLKLGHLLGEIGQRLPDGDFWPRLSPGFGPLWAKIAKLEDVNTGVITSGHRSFVERFHDVHELSLPDYMVTDDDMRPLMAHLPQALCVKPSELLVSLIHRQWIESYRPELESFDEPLTDSKHRILYVGDDKIKDGQMARNYGIDFRLINVNNPELCWFLTETSVL